MYKLATLSAVVAASNMEEFKQTHQMFEISVKQKEFKALKEHAKKLQTESEKYSKQMQASSHGKQFKQEAQALTQAQEFTDLTKFVEEMTTKIADDLNTNDGVGLSESYTKFKAKYEAQVE